MFVVAGNSKYYYTSSPRICIISELNSKPYLPNKLPVEAAIGGNIQAGDLMLYGNNCLVLFYESFNTSYSYTKLGKVDDVEGLVAALGKDNVIVKFELL